ncbi:MAG: metallophosphoesterase family protein [Pseudomonadota bacterium]
MRSKRVKHVGCFLGEPVGVMADSHGSAAAIAAALAIFAANGCRRVVHLGDICDSESPATANAATRPLMDASVLTVMGNNEHAVLQRAGTQFEIDVRVRAFMATLPLQIETEGHIFVHNRPFPDRLGVSCLMGEITAADCRRIDRRYQGVVLFRGHAHQPSVCHSALGPIPGGSTAGETVVLTSGDNWVVTCGALQTGWYMIWHPGLRALTVCRL